MFKDYTSEKGYVLVIGGSTIDIQGFPFDKVKMHDSNPGIIKTSLGGVGRNIADNLSRLSVNVKLITAVGDDVYGKKIIKGSSVGIDFTHSLIIEGKSTSTYLSVLDEKGDMVIAVSHMDIFENISVDFISRKHSVIQDSMITVLDTNIPEEVLDYITSKYKDKIFFLDTVSSKKAMKVKNIIGRFHTIKPNKIECEMLTGIEIRKKEDVKRVEEYFFNKGVKRLFISLGEQGLFYSDRISKGFIDRKKIKVVNATGAGDAFVAALVYGYLNDFDISYTARFSMAASLLALSHEDTIASNMSVMEVKNKMLEENLC